jgi:hypothetical protein
VDLVVAELRWGLLEVARQLADVVDVSLDGLGRTVSQLQVFDEAMPERSHGDDSRGRRGEAGGATAAIILARESPGRKSF